MAYSLLAHTHFKGASNGGTTSAIDTTGSDLIVLGVVSNTSGITAPTDSASNTWTNLTIQAGSQEKAQLFYCHAPTTSATHTFSVGGTGEFQGVYVLALSGSRSSPFDVENGSNLSNATTFQPGSVTPSLANSLIVAFESDDYAGGSGGIQSIDSSFIITDQENQQSFVCLGASMTYLIQGASAAVNPTWSVTGGNRNFAGNIAVFKALGDANVNLTAVSSTGVAEPLVSNSNVNLVAITSSGAAAAVSMQITSNLDLVAVSSTGSASAITPSPGPVLVSVSASGQAASFSQNNTFDLVAVSASGHAAQIGSSAQIISLACIGRMRDTLPIDAIMSNRPVASNGTMRNTPVPAVGTLLAA